MASPSPPARWTRQVFCRVTGVLPSCTSTKLAGLKKLSIDEAGFAETTCRADGPMQPQGYGSRSAKDFLKSLHLEELLLTRACAMDLNPRGRAFLSRYRDSLYEAAYKIAREESTARELAASLYADLYGVDRRASTEPPSFGTTMVAVRYKDGSGPLSRRNMSTAIAVRGTKPALTPLWKKVPSSALRSSTCRWSTQGGSGDSCRVGGAEWR